MELPPASELRFSGSSNPHIFGTRLTGEFVSSKILHWGHATQRPTFVFASAGFGCQCRPPQRINMITLTVVVPSGEYQSLLYLSLQATAFGSGYHTHFAIIVLLLPFPPALVNMKQFFAHSNTREIVSKKINPNPKGPFKCYVT